jgi:purine catabolism regulator
MDPTLDTLARVDALHTGLTAIVLDDGDLSRIAQEVAEVLDVGALVTSSDGRVLGEHVSERQRELLVAADLLEPTGRLRVERLVEVSPIGAGSAVAVPVATTSTDLARLVAVRDRGDIDGTDVHALQRAATIAALLITRHEAVNAVENRYRGDFLRDVFLRRAGQAAYVAEHAATFGWTLDRAQVVVCAELDRPEEEDVSEQQQRRWQERFATGWRLVAARLSPDSPSVDFGSQVVTLLPVDGTGSAQALVEQTVREVAGDRGGGRRSFSVGVSRVAGSLRELPDAYAQAVRAVTVGRRVHGPRSTTWFDDLGIHRLIALVPDPGELTAFATDVLGPLAADTTEAADLRETLQRLLDTNFNVAEAARLQFFHYNTMRYRLGKIERLLGPLSTDPHLRLDVAVALRVLEIQA